MSEFYEKIAACNPNHQNVALTVTGPGHTGEKALLSNRALVWESAKGGFFSQNLGAVSALSDTGLADIAGRQVFCEFLGHEKQLVVCGAGHVSIPIIRIGKMIGCPVTVLDDRPKFADDARRAGADRVICEPFAQGLAQIPGDQDTFFIIVTRGHRYDQTCLELIAQKEHAYIGMIGSRARTARVKQALAERGIDRAVLDSVYTPIGLKIGADTPEEIAVSIMAEVIQVKNRSLRRGGYSREILDAILEEGAKDIPKILATIVSRKGSSPRDVGTKMLIFRDGRTVGTIGGGCLEADVFRRAVSLFADGAGQTCLYHADMTGKDAEDDGMVCGGQIDVLLEVIENTP